MAVPKLFPEKAVQSIPHCTCFSHTFVIIRKYPSFTIFFSSFVGEKEQLTVAFTGISLITSDIKRYLTCVCVFIATPLTHRIYLFLT